MFHKICTVTVWHFGVLNSSTSFSVCLVLFPFYCVLVFFRTQQNCHQTKHTLKEIERIGANKWAITVNSFSSILKTKLRSEMKHFLFVTFRKAYKLLLLLWILWYKIYFLRFHRGFGMFWVEHEPKWITNYFSARDLDVCSWSKISSLSHGSNFKLSMFWFK